MVLMIYGIVFWHLYCIYILLYLYNMYIVYNIIITALKGEFEVNLVFLPRPWFYQAKYSLKSFCKAIFNGKMFDLTNVYDLTFKSVLFLYQHGQAVSL